MTQTTSSAEYLQLYRYSDVALQLDNDLVGEARRLRGVLEHFEATCREPSCRQQVAHVADGMVAHGARAAVVDAWVHVVGLGFQAADGGGLVALLPHWLPPWLLWPPIRWPVDPGFIIGPRPRPRPPQWFWPPYQWGLPPWLLPIIGWPGGRDWMIPLPVWPPLTRPYMPVPVDPPGNGGGAGETELGKLLPPKEPPVGDITDGETELGKLLRPRPKEALRQDDVKDLDPLLGVIRYDRTKDGQLVPEGSIKTVRDHIRHYGCLMTCFTMLLRDLGKNVTITDIYRANYKRKTGRSIEEDLARDDDQDGKPDIVLEDLYIDPNAIKDVTQNEYEVVNGDNLYSPLKPQKPDDGSKGAVVDPTAKLCENLANYGSVIIWVTTPNSDGHWVVVDSYDKATGTFTVRNPTSGLVENARIPSSEYTPKQGIVKRLKPM